MAKKSRYGRAKTKGGGRGKAKASLSSLRPRGVSPLTLGLLGVGVVGAGVLLAKKASAATSSSSSSTLSPASSPPIVAVEPPNPAPAPSGSPAQNLTPGQAAQVTGAPHGVHLRSAPGNGLGGSILALLPQGTGVLVLDVSRPDGWVKVQVPAGTAGLSSVTVGWLCDTCGLDGLTVDSPALSPGVSAPSGQGQTVASSDGGTPGDTTPSQPQDNTNPLANLIQNFLPG